MSDRVDVIVVGAGPAGAIAAYLLAKHGFRVTLLERDRLPRDKVCGGGLQAKVLNEIPFDVMPTIEATAYGIAFTRQFAHGFVRRNPSPIIYQVSRTRFDALLVENASHAGASVLDGLRVVSVEAFQGRCRISTVPSSDFSPDFVIFADGANGIGYHSLNTVEHRFLQWGTECDTPFGSSIGIYDSTLVSVDWGTMPDGYGWIFPKRDHLVVGCGGPSSQTRSLKSYLSALARLLGFDDIVCTNVRAHPIPSYRPGVILATDRCLLAGDAGGFVEPFSGEGISYAVRTGALAANAVIETASGRHRLPKIYSELVTPITTEILTLRKLKEFFALVPQHVHQLYRRNDRVWAEFTGALQGTRAATVVRDNAPFALLWPLIDQVAAAFYRRQLRRRIDLEPADFDQFIRQAPAIHPALRPTT